MGCRLTTHLAKGSPSAAFVALRHPAVQILPPRGMMSLKDLKEHHYAKYPALLSIKNLIDGMSLCDRAGP